MSAIGSSTSLTSQSAINAFNIDFNDVEGTQDYSVNGEAQTEPQVNAMLAAYGLKMIDGNMQTTDGMAVNAGALGAATNFTGTPALPDVDGDMAPSGQVSGELNGAFGDDMGPAAMMWLALSTFAKSSQQDMKSAKELKQAMHEGKISAKKGQIKGAETEIAAQRAAADEAVMTAVVMAVVVIACSMIGAGGLAGSASGTIAAAGSALGAVGQKVMEADSKNSGAQADADKAKLQQMDQALVETMMDEGISTAQSNYDSAKEMFKLALKVIAEHYELQSQAIQKIT